MALAAAPNQLQTGVFAGNSEVVTFVPPPSVPHTSEPFTKTRSSGTLAVGKDPLAVMEKTKRRQDRKKAVLPVRIKGKDSSGKVFDDLAHTLDVTATGVRLGSVRHELQKLEQVTVLYRQRRIEFRVVWTKKMKDSGEYQVGLQALTSERDAWGLSSSEFKAGDVMASAAPVAQPAGTV